MRQLRAIAMLCTFFLASASAKIIIVDKAGSGQYLTIQSAINAAQANTDTIRVYPGIYNESLIVNKAIVIQGSGYETTIITSSNNPTITMSAAAKMMWFAITSSGGNGANLPAGTITNCVVSGCTALGVYFPSNSTGSVKNCVLVGNAQYAATGFQDYPIYAGRVTNSIAKNNNGGGDQFNTLGGLTYSAGKYGVFISGASNNITADPQFISSTDYHISPTSPCWDSGNPSDQDPDGSVSDMGYYGGFDAPVFPIVTEVRIIPQSTGVQIKAKVRANY